MNISRNHIAQKVVFLTIALAQGLYSFAQLPNDRGGPLDQWTSRAMTLIAQAPEESRIRLYMLLSLDALTSGNVRFFREIEQTTSDRLLIVYPELLGVPVELGSPQLAWQLLSEISSIESRDKALAEMGLAFSNKYQFDGAQSCVEIINSRSVKNELLFEMAKILTRAGKTDEAFRSLEVILPPVQWGKNLEGIPVNNESLPPLPIKDPNKEVERAIEQSRQYSDYVVRLVSESKPISVTVLVDFEGGFKRVTLENVKLNGGKFEGKSRLMRKIEPAISVDINRLCDWKLGEGMPFKGDFINSVTEFERRLQFAREMVFESIGSPSRPPIIHSRSTYEKILFNRIIFNCELTEDEINNLKQSLSAVKDDYSRFKFCFTASWYLIHRMGSEKARTAVDLFAREVIVRSKNRRDDTCFVLLANFYLDIEENLKALDILEHIEWDRLRPQNEIDLVTETLIRVGQPERAFQLIVNRSLEAETEWEIENIYKCWRSFGMFCAMHNQMEYLNKQFENIESRIEKANMAVGVVAGFNSIVKSVGSQKIP